MSRPSIAIFDDFFPDPEAARAAIVSGPFLDFKSPWDGVSYPGINKEIPEEIKHFVVKRLSEILGAPVEPAVIFARLTSKNTSESPHQIHSDRLMAEFSAHVYISKHWPMGAGTSFWAHESEGRRHTEDTDVELVQEDMKDLSKWIQVFTAQGDFNRLVVHDASFWHCAEPVGGWGETAEDGRVVLTCFFNVRGPK
jgi:hypothetical protein